jgi:hypothetical protein
MTSRLFLDRAELKALTGRSRPGAQRRALAAMGVPHRVRPDGQPVVAVRDLQPREEQAPTIQQPNWDALRQSSNAERRPNGDRVQARVSGISG